MRFSSWNKRNEKSILISLSLILLNSVPIETFTIETIKTHIRAIRPSLSFTTTTSLSAHSLSTAYEWLSEERCSSDPAYKDVRWINPSDPCSSSSNQNENDNDNENWVLPLYPLSATYLPYTDIDYILNNVEPRNIKMALDLFEKDQNDDDDDNDTDDNDNYLKRCFCVVLCTADTGKIASIGTVLQIVNIEKQEVNGELVRIKVICRSKEELVEICNIENPNAASREQRLRRSSEYLRAKVRPFRGNDNPFRNKVQANNNPSESIYSSSIATSIGNTTSSISTDTLSTTTTTSIATTTKTTTPSTTVDSIIPQIIKNYKQVRIMYQLGIGSHELPLDSLSTLAEHMPEEWIEEDFLINDQSFWKIAQIWQSVCETIRHGKQMMLSTNRNEVMIDAASKDGGGPLKLPIHVEDLSPQVQRELQLMEVQAQNDYTKLGLDPCLDFQAMLSMTQLNDRIQFLHRLIERERIRLEEIIASNGSFSINDSRTKDLLDDDDDDNNNDDDDNIPRKGAWFSDDYW